MRRTVLLAACLLLVFAKADDVSSRVRDAMKDTPDVAALRAIGPKAMPVLVEMYKNGNEDQRAAIAGVWYGLGWKSPQAKAALMRDVDTQNSGLRVNVQYALGRVSDDVDVIDTLAGIMQTDLNAHFRDKAACALAYDQIHLSEEEKVRLYEKVIAALRDPKLQVRQIASQVLHIHTGQTKGFVPDGPLAQRTKAVKAWEAWLAEYRSNL